MSDLSGVFPDAPKPTSYNDLAAELLASIADALLGGKKDWATLERLQDALKPPSAPSRYKQPMTSDTTNLLKSIYEPKVEEMLNKELPAYFSRYADEEVMRKLLEPDPDLPKKIRDASYTVNFSRMYGKDEINTSGLTSGQWIEWNDKK